MEQLRKLSQFFRRDQQTTIEPKKSNPLDYRGKVIQELPIIEQLGVELIDPYKREDIENQALLPGNNYYLIDENKVAFAPPNDRLNSAPIRAYYRDPLKPFPVEVLDNQNGFIEISNLAEVLRKMTNILYASTFPEKENKVALDPYGDFLLKLTDPIGANYHGNAELVVVANKPNNYPEEKAPDAQAYFSNRYLDHFIGWNFGVAIQQNSELQDELMQFNSRMISSGKREYAGPGLSHYVFQRLGSVEPFDFPTK